MCGIDGEDLEEDEARDGDREENGRDEVGEQDNNNCLNDFFI